jgi:opacity protein-like surface antigen
MNMKKIALFLSIGFAASTFAAGADSMYVAGSGHINMINDMHDKGAIGNGGVSRSDTRIKFKSGYNVGLALGYRMGDIAAEGEVSKFASNVDKATVEDTTFRATPKDAITKDISELSGFMFMVNVHYAFSELINLPESVVPRIGVGIGMTSATLNANNKSFNSNGSDDSHSKFAYQAIVGVDMPFDAVTVGLEYRYMNMQGIPYMLDSTATVSQQFNSEAAHNMIGLHVAYSF